MWISIGQLLVLGYWLLATEKPLFIDLCEPIKEKSQDWLGSFL